MIDQKRKRRKNGERKGGLGGKGIEDEKKEGGEENITPNVNNQNAQNINGTHTLIKPTHLNHPLR